MQAKPKSTRSFQAAKDFLDTFTNYEKRGSVRLKRGDLSRTASLLKLLNDPQERIPAVHVTGSKGKGSFCLLLEALLREEGLRVGTYLSPHVECITERIRVGGRQLSQREFAEGITQLKGPVSRMACRPTYFEILTALAWQSFAESNVQLALFEAGIGGRYDATALLNPVLTVLTSIEREHTSVLGETEGEILKQKLAIARPGKPFLTGRLKPRLNRTAVEEIKRLGAQEIMWQSSIRLRYRNQTAHLGLLGELPEINLRFFAPNRPFAVNASLAVAAKILLTGSLPYNPDALFSTCELPARQEVFEGSPPFIVDSAHTYQSLTALKETVLRLFPKSPVVVVFALSRDKNAARLLPVLRGFVKRCIFTQADPVRGFPAQALYELSSIKEKSVAPEPKEALKLAASKAEEGGLVCVCGSFYLAGEARKWVKRNRRALR